MKNVESMFHMFDKMRNIGFAEYTPNYIVVNGGKDTYLSKDDFRFLLSGYRDSNKRFDYIDYVIEAYKYNSIVYCRASGRVSYTNRYYDSFWESSSEKSFSHNSKNIYFSMTESEFDKMTNKSNRNSGFNQCDVLEYSLEDKH